MRRYRQVTIICIPCAELMPPPSDRWAPLTPEQVREVLDWRANEDRRSAD